MKIIIKIPNGDSCKGCPYTTQKWITTHYNEGYNEITCVIFNAIVTSGKKCDKCILEAE